MKSLSWIREPKAEPWGTLMLKGLGKGGASKGDIEGTHVR